MSKLRLMLDELEVDTFQAGEVPAPGRGTVDAHAATSGPHCVVSAQTNLTCCPCTPEV
jgi:hypothetical protein